MKRKVCRTVRWSLFAFLIGSVLLIGNERSLHGQGRNYTLRWIWPAPARTSTSPITPVRQDSPSRLELFSKSLDSAQAMLQAGKYAAARQAADRADSAARCESQRAIIEAIRDRIGEAGQKELAAYCQAYQDKEFARAIAGFSRISADYGNLPCAAQARLILKEAQDSFEVQTALELDKARELETSLAQSMGPPGRERVEAVRKSPPDEQARTIETLEQIINLAGDDPVGKQAADDLQTLKRDPDLVRNVQRCTQDAKARKLMQLAENYLAASRADKAMELYRQVVQDCPLSRCAQNASRQLASMEGARASGGD